MTVIADNKKRVTLPTKPGERFDLQAVGDDKFILSRLEPVPLKQARVTFRKKDGYTVARTERPMNEAALREALEDFP